MIVSLYQTFPFGCHRYLVITEWGKVLFKNRRKYIWYTLGWAISVVPLSFFYNTLRIGNDADYTLDKETENRNIKVCIIAIPEFVYMILVLVLYFLAMCSLKRRYLNTSISKVSNSILHSKRQNNLKSMSQSAYYLVVMITFSSLLLVRNALGIVQPLPTEV